MSKPSVRRSRRIVALLSIAVAAMAILIATPERPDPAAGPRVAPGDHPCTSCQQQRIWIPGMTIGPIGPFGSLPIVIG
jgi:hypothetical protein